MKDYEKFAPACVYFYGYYLIRDARSLSIPVRYGIVWLKM